MGTTPSLVPQVGPDGIPGDVPIIAYTEKLLEEKELQLKKYIQENYSKIRDVERELENLTLELKLTAGPKKAALEHLRKKIESSTEKIRVARQKEEQARKGRSNWCPLGVGSSSEDFEGRGGIQTKNLRGSQPVQDSASVQYSRLEELKRRLEALNPEPRGGAAESVTAKYSGSLSASTEYSATGRSNLDGTGMGPVTLNNPAVSIGTLSQQSSSESNNNASLLSANLHSLPDQLPSSRPANIPHDKKGVNKLHPDSQGLSANQVAEGQHVTIMKGRGYNVGRGKGNLVLQKAKGEPASGWTGAGFDVDART